MAEPAKKPRKERKENANMRRRQILDAARRSIVANGLSKTTLATVANEAGLSQGVAVFYYKSKGGIFSAVLEDLYQAYEDNWRQALAGADQTPLAQLEALVRADFAEAVCNPETLAIWFAFWGELKTTPQYAEITSEFEQHRTEAIVAACQSLFPSEDAAQARELAEWIDTLTDGFWQRIHLGTELKPQVNMREEAVESTMRFMRYMLSE